MMRLFLTAFTVLTLLGGAASAAEPIKLRNMIPPLFDEDDPRSHTKLKEGDLPIVVPPFVEHVREAVPGVPEGKVVRLSLDANGALLALTAEGKAFRREAGGDWSSAEAPKENVRTVQQGQDTWKLADGVLYLNDKRYESYGVEGPLASRVTSLAIDSKGTLWIGTPLGLTRRTAEGRWGHVRGKEGLPHEEVTAISVNAQDELWLGTTAGAVLYKPYADGRQWFYRAGERYLPDDRVLDAAAAPNGSVAYFATEGGLGAIRSVTTTLLEKAQTIERRVNERHRRYGLVATCIFNNPDDPNASFIEDSDNDGLWTAYHVGAMSLCYDATKDPAAKESARTSMHALYMLQNASGVPGLVARSVVPLEIGLTKSPQWRPTPDGKMYWKSDTSSDEIDGHFFAFYTYWTHIAKDDPEERDLCIKQVRSVMDYILQNNYQLIDWTGKRTRWGFWNPENLNDNPTHYLENGLNSLEILSFLKTTYAITGDEKYEQHYQNLLHEHGYLHNVLVSKKVFPDINNHSDDQLGYVAWYPILQAEKDPEILAALTAAVRRHYKIVRPEKPSFYAFVTGTVDPHYVDFQDAVDNLKEIPTDRRQYRVDNGRRADVVIDPSKDRFHKKQLLLVPPADERSFAKWNGNPYLAESGDGQHVEDDGSAYLLPYWMGRYHGFIAEQGK
jgi:hypothetical protein